MRQLTTLDAQFLAVESARTYGHVGSLAVYDPSTTPGGELGGQDLCRLVGARLHLVPAPPPGARAPPSCLRCAGPSPPCPAASTCPTGSRTPTSTSTSTSASPQSRRPVTTASSPRPSRGSLPARSTAAARCGRSTSSTASPTATSRC